MKIETTGHIAISGGMQGKTQYQIAQSGKVMDMLANSLYSDKVRAVVRELSTNAWDAHIMAGTTGIGPQIHLPNSISPKFYIRDFGTGMSRDQLETMYQTYGMSTKDQSNDFNGCMGIGSKSPFAYARSFVTTSFYNGKKYIYINSKDDKNMPQLQFAGEFDTDEPNGLMIEVTVQPQDYVKFQHAAESVLKWFPVEFEILNCPYFKKAHREYLREGNGWKIRKDTNVSCAIMGFVEYPIEPNHFSDLNTTRDVTWYQYHDKTPVVKLLHLGLELHFEIGEVEMAIHREGLQYSPETVKKIRKRLDQVLVELKDQASKDFAACKTLWEARCHYQEYNSGHLAGVRELLSVAGVEWNGHKLNESYDMVKLPEGVRLTGFNKYYRNKAKKENIVYRIAINKDVLFIEGDMERGNYVTAERYMDRHNSCKQLYLVEFDNAKARQEFIDWLGIDPSLIAKTSSMPKPPKKARVKQERVFLFQCPAAGKGVRGDRNGQNQYWSDGGVEFKKGGIYVELNNWNVYSGGKSIGNAVELVSIIRALDDLGVKIPEIAGVKTAVIKKYDDSAKWTNFFDWAKAEIQKKIDTKKSADTLSKSADYRRFSHSPEGSFYLNLMEKAEKTVQKNDGNFQKMLDKFAEYRKIYEVELPKVEKIDRVLTLLGINGAGTNNASDTTLSDLNTQVRKQYKFLCFVSQWDVYETDKANLVIDLVNLFDSQS